MILPRIEAIDHINKLSRKRQPFVFFTDFLGEKCWVKTKDQIQETEIRYQFGNQLPSSTPKLKFQFSKTPIAFSRFKQAHDYVINQINIGNSFLVNLTFKTPIETELSLDDIFEISRAKYKLRYQDQFVVFSPETFVKIENGHIYSYPMKGTIDASVPDAKNTLLADPKELAEHVTIVDLIRNDLSQVASQIEVSNFRFITEVKAHDKSLLQVSSEVKGTLPNDYLDNLGTILFRLLPAGSISGAPKPKTIEIIQNAEDYDRNFYTGICGQFDGETLDSGVMIRFIEKTANQLCYKSGGGITSFSQAEKEYQELIDKIYVPVY